MKKAITITFGLIGLVFGLVFASTKIEASSIGNNTFLYRAQRTYYNYDTIRVIADDLSNPINFNQFVYYWTTLNESGDIAIITIDTIYVEYVYNFYDVGYSGYLDSIVLKKYIYNGAEYQYSLRTIFYHQGEEKISFVSYDNDFIGFVFNVTGSVQDEFGDIRYDTGYLQGYNKGRFDGIEEASDLDGRTLYNNGYNDGYKYGKSDGYQIGYTDGYNEKTIVSYDDGYNQGVSIGYNNGYDKGYKEGVSTVYENGFGGFINPDTNNPYDETASFPYGKGYQDGFTSTESGGLWNVMFSALLAPFQVLGFELLPGVTLGMIVAVPLVFGLLAWILSVGKSKK